jgi:hypothetical protein
MKLIKISAVLLACTIAASSCTKVIDLDIKENTSKLVVAGGITNEAGPYNIKLSKTVAITESNTNTEVNNATVIISDNAGTVDTLTSKGGGNYETSKIVGTPGRTYSLKVIADGSTYEASSTMPNPVALTALKPLQIDFGGQKRTVIVPIYVDPTGLGNNYNFNVFKNGKLQKSYLLWNDNVSNGLQNQRPLGGPGIELNSGDTVTVEMQCVDKRVYDYFYALQQLQGNGPGGGTTPSDPANNISNGGLGIFSAYANQTLTSVIP